MLKRLSLAMGLVLSMVGGLRAELKIEHIQAAIGPYWPSKTDNIYHPGDVISYRYLVSGLGVNEKKSIDATVSWTMKTADGKKIDGKTQTWNYLPALGQGTAPHMTAIEVTNKYTPGEYTLHVDVKDHISEKKASFERTLVIKPEEWAISAVAFFHDPEGRFPACLDGHVGDQVYYKMKIIGYDKTRIDAELEMQILDQNGKEIGVKPFTQVFVNNNSRLIQSVPFLSAEGTLPTFTRPGDFKLRIIMTDHVNEKSAVYEAPVHVSCVP